MHVAVTVYFAVMVIRDMYAPQHDPVRSDGFEEDRDDPGGGAYDGAPDRFTLRRRSAEADRHVEA